MAFFRRCVAPSLLLLLLIGLFSPFALAEQTPEEAAEAYMQYFRERRWTAMAGMMLEEDLAAFKDLMVEMLSAVPEDDPSEAEILAMLLGPGTTREEIIEADPTSLFAGMLRFGMGMLAVRIDAFEVLGAVEETPELSHVVARSTVSMYGGLFSTSALEVMSFTKTPDGWRLSSGGQIEAMVEMVQSMLAQQQRGLSF